MEISDNIEIPTNYYDSEQLLLKKKSMNNKPLFAIPIHISSKTQHLGIPYLEIVLLQCVRNANRRTCYIVSVFSCYVFILSQYAMYTYVHVMCSYTHIWVRLVPFRKPETFPLKYQLQTFKYKIHSVEVNLYYFKYL